MSTNFIAKLFFPEFCINCQREGTYLCEDCFQLVDFLIYSPKIISACPYQNFIVKKLITQSKYEPFVKDLAKTLASLIIHYIKLNGKQRLFSQKDFLIPVPLTKKRLKERGFNQSEEIAKELSSFLKVPLASDVLFKIKETPPQVELPRELREKNLRDCFAVKNGGKIKDKKILLLDDVYTTGSTMAEAARVLKIAGAKEILPITVARE